MRMKKKMGSRKRRWMEDEMDSAGEFNGERGDVVHPCTSNFAVGEEKILKALEMGGETEVKDGT